MRVTVSGSTGLVGRHLVEALTAAGHDVLRLVRGPSRQRGTASWDPSRGHIDSEALDADAVVHLAGVPIAGRRWNDSYKRSIRDSRVDGTSLIASEIARRPERSRPRVLLSASAVGFYGDRGDEVLTEDSPSGGGFLAGVCRAWEGATGVAADAGVRTALLRSGIVLAADGGALRPQLLAFRAGLGGRLGSGRQWVSWISIDDEVGAILHALDDEALSGPVNMVAPAPVTNAAFTGTLARAVHRPAVFAVPAPALRLALGAEMADEMLLVSQRVMPGVLDRSGYQWRHPQLEPALRDVLGR